MKVSLWLLPPEPLRTKLQRQIQLISEDSSSRLGTAKIKGVNKCPTFIPHVTVLGGVDCHPDEVEQIAERLKMTIRGVGKVPCRFGEKVVYSVDDNGDILWNQSCVATMERSPEFLALVKLSTLAMSPRGRANLDDPIKFPPPLCEPHFSYAYGSGPDVCDDLEPPPDFDAWEAALFWTYPSTLAGVNEWTEIVRVRLC